MGRTRMWNSCDRNEYKVLIGKSEGRRPLGNLDTDRMIILK
jgi:hypothetical protein